MKISIKNLKTFIGREGHGYTCTVYVDGKRVIQAHDAADGGPVQTLQIHDPKLFDRLQDRAKSHGGWEAVVGGLIDQTSIKKSTRKTVYRVIDENQIYTLKAHYNKQSHNRIVAYLDEQYPGNYTLISGMPVVGVI